MSAEPDDGRLPWPPEGCVWARFMGGPWDGLRELIHCEPPAEFVLYGFSEGDYRPERDTVYRRVHEVEQFDFERIYYPRLSLVDAGG